MIGVTCSANHAAEKDLSSRFHNNIQQYFAPVNKLVHPREKKVLLFTLLAMPINHLILVLIRWWTKHWPSVHGILDILTKFTTLKSTTLKTLFQTSATEGTAIFYFTLHVSCFYCPHGPQVPFWIPLLYSKNNRQTQKKVDSCCMKLTSFTFVFH